VGITEDRRRERIRADKELLEGAARTLRHRVTQDAYCGLRDRESGYALAGIFDAFALHYVDAPGGLVWQALHAAEQIMRQQPSGPSVQLGAPR
jgi:hypothetical protein